MNFKSSFLAILLCFALFSCSSTGEGSSLSTKMVEKNGFKILIPNSWEEIQTKDLPQKIKTGEIVLAFTSTDISSGFANNLSIIEGKVKSSTTSKEYSLVNYTRTTRSLVQHTKLATTGIVFPDKESGLIYTFEGQYNKSAPLQKFMQTAKVCNNRVYLMTLGLGPQAQGLKKYEDLLASFECQ